jgi:hypothetical protein
MKIKIHFDSCTCGSSLIQYTVTTGVRGWLTETEVKCAKCKKDLKRKRNK